MVKAGKPACSHSFCHSVIGRKNGLQNNKKGEQDYEKETTGRNLCTGITAFHDSGS
jgi:hypothetical protein